MVKKLLGKCVYNILESMNLGICVCVCGSVSCVCVYVCECKRDRGCFLWYMGILTVRLKIHRVFYRDAFVHRAVFPFLVPMHLSSICNVYFPRPNHRVQLQQPYSLPINDFSFPSLTLSSLLFCLFSTISLSVCTSIYVDPQPICFFPSCVVFLFELRVLSRLFSFLNNFFLYKFDKAIWTVANARLNPIEKCFQCCCLLIRMRCCCCCCGSDAVCVYFIYCYRSRSIISIILRSLSGNAYIQWKSLRGWHGFIHIFLCI